MNSEQLKIIENVVSRTEPLTDQELKFSKLANDMSDLIKSPAWLYLVGEYEKVIQQLYDSMSKVKTLKELQSLQARIEVLKLVIKGPDKPLNEAKLFLKRRTKW